MQTPLYNFYHVWADGNWQFPLSRHVEALQVSGLAEKLSSFEVGIVGQEKKREDVKKYLYTSGIKFKICNESNDGYEQETLDSLVSSANIVDGYVLYAHTKGSYNDTIFEHSWTSSMNNDLIINWPTCINLLQDYALVGCHYAIPSERGMICYNSNVGYDAGFFYGNFWWSHMRYLKALGRPFRSPLTDGGYSRYDAEYWMINLKSIVKDKPFRVYDLNPYFDEEHFKDHRIC